MMDRLDFGGILLDEDGNTIIKDKEAVEQLKDKNIPTNVKINSEVKDNGK